MSRFRCLILYPFLISIFGKLQAQQAVWPDNGIIYDNKIHRIDIFLPKDSWAKMNKNIWIMCISIHC